MNETEILIFNTIDKLFYPGGYFYTPYFNEQLKSPLSLKFIAEIMDKSGKSATEAIIIVLVAIRYFTKDTEAFLKIEKNNSFQSLLENNYSELLNISIKGKVQGNAPERALPILEVLSEKLSAHSQIAVIELGASFGLIGHVLLNPEYTLSNISYFEPNQQLPIKTKSISSYLGIDLNPPEKDWLISCILNYKDAKRIENYINHINYQNNFQVIKASALGFSDLQEVKNLINSYTQIVILTSFVLYQLNEQTKTTLVNEINNFCKKHNAFWIKQDVEIIPENNISNCFIEFENELIIKLSDDKCISWKWV